MLNKEIQDHINLVNRLKDELPEVIDQIAKLIILAIESGNKLILFGNGGSAADAQHIAAEFTGRYVKERIGLPAIALTTDTSALTAIGNDYGFDFVFSRQIEAIAKEGDVVIGISTSGNSVNVLKAIEKANFINCKTISLTGNKGGLIAKCSLININVNHDVTARIQEMHILIGHLICSAVDNKF